MTRKLYYENAFLASFSAVVLKVLPYKNRYAVVLDQTAFFPEGGGQPGDQGFIGNVEVTDTQIQDGIIYHIVVSAPELTAGMHVACELNWPLRFARMQSHSGEHIVSGIAHNMFGVNNVGFHMDNTLMTVDFDQPLTKENLAEIEKAANACVYRNIPVTAWFPDEEQLKKLNYRSKTDDLQQIRIVTVEGYDDCACCAVHVDCTGKIGLIKILSSVSHRGGVRITLLCGVSAYNDYVCKHEQTLHIADVLAAKHAETGSAVDKLIEKEKELAYQMRAKTLRHIEYIKLNTLYSNGNLVISIPEFTPEEIKTAVLALRGRCGGICVVVSGDDCKGYSFAASAESVKVQSFSKTFIPALSGRGGGNADVVQGRFGASLREIKDYFESFKVYENENAQEKTS